MKNTKYNNLFKMGKNEMIEFIKEDINSVNEYGIDGYFRDVTIGIEVNDELMIFYAEQIPDIKVDFKKITRAFVEDGDNVYIIGNIKDYDIELPDEEDIDNILVFKNTVTYIDFKLN